MMRHKNITVAIIAAAILIAAAVMVTGRFVKASNESRDYDLASPALYVSRPEEGITGIIRDWRDTARLGPPFAQAVASLPDALVSACRPSESHPVLITYYRDGSLAFWAAARNSSIQRLVASLAHDLSDGYSPVEERRPDGTRLYHFATADNRFAHLYHNHSVVGYSYRRELLTSPAYDGVLARAIEENTVTTMPAIIYHDTAYRTFNVKQSATHITYRCALQALPGYLTGKTDSLQTDAIPASYLQKHENICFYADDNSASMLSRIVAPWLVGPCEWTPKFVRKAVVWLCETVHKPILKLTHQDYIQNSLGELLEQKGAYDKINIDVFNDLQHTITGWPGGKPNADDSTRPVPSEPFPKRVVVFSPHPDDDVISMGGTFIRLVEQGHDVHVAYETSGNVAVHDDVVLQHMDTAHELGFADKFNEVKAIVASKKPGEPEPRALLDIKGAIRRAEARAAVRSFGLNENTNAHFLNLPFYETGGIKKGQRTQKDIDIIIDLLNKVKPHQIYLAGDLADPHGTHRVCTEAVLEALDQLKGESWMKECHVWLYRGAWMEWELGKVDMAVPLSPDELIKKRHAIYRHVSQKDIVPFPGDDSREFWQRAEDRTQNTARLYNELGMAEYQAIEVFVKLF